MRQTKATKYLNSISRAQRRSGPSSRAECAFVLYSNLRKIPRYTIQIFGIFLFGLFFVTNTSALEYQNATNVQFTFEPTISVSVSDDLVIDELSPGTAKDSNIVNVTVSTNVLAGYYLSATTGTKNTNTDLSHTSGNDYKFTNLSVNKTTVESFNDNTWGYSYSNDGGATWVSGNVSNPVAGYNGLPKDNNDANDANNTNDTNATNSTSSELGKGGTTLINTNSDADSSTIKFKIGAKASMAQAAGTYTNTINFYAVSKVPPISISDAFAAAGKIRTTSGYYKMQDMDATICSMTQTLDEESQTQLIDIRDNKVYWVAKLRDGHCWMTQNLDLDITSGVALTSETTDLNVSGIAPYIEGYIDNSGVISWTPQDWTSSGSLTEDNVSVTTRTPNSSGEFDDWVNGGTACQDGCIHPLSADPGEWYQKSDYSDSVNYNYLVPNNPCQNITKFAATADSSHGHVGNYYNYTASIASNNTDNVDADYQENSICSANWRLPNIYTNDFAALNNLYNSSSLTSDVGLFEPPLYLVRSGYVSSGTLAYASYYGYYWSGVLRSNATAYNLRFGSMTVGPTYSNMRWYGFSIRCLAK